MLDNREEFTYWPKWWRISGDSEERKEKAGDTHGTGYAL